MRAGVAAEVAMAFRIARDRPNAGTKVKSLHGSTCEGSATDRLRQGSGGIVQARDRSDLLSSQSAQDVSRAGSAAWRQPLRASQSSGDPVRAVDDDESEGMCCISARFNQRASNSGTLSPDGARTRSSKDVSSEEELWQDDGDTGHEGWGDVRTDPFRVPAADCTCVDEVMNRRAHRARVGAAGRPNWKQASRAQEVGPQPVSSATAPESQSPLIKTRGSPPAGPSTECGAS